MTTIRSTALLAAQQPDDHLELMAVRRCLYGDGRAAHVMYRLNGEPVSLFVIPGLARPGADLSLLRDELARVAPYLRNEAK